MVCGSWIRHAMNQNESHFSGSCPSIVSLPPDKLLLDQPREDQGRRTKPISCQSEDCWPRRGGPSMLLTPILSKFWVPFWGRADRKQDLESVVVLGLVLGEGELNSDKEDADSILKKKGGINLLPHSLCPPFLSFIIYGLFKCNYSKGGRHLFGWWVFWHHPGSNKAWREGIKLHRLTISSIKTKISWSLVVCTKSLDMPLSFHQFFTCVHNIHCTEGD